MLIREELEQIEHQSLSKLASFSDQTRGRQKTERPCHVRPAYQHDRDRIIHSKPFRRLKHKTQVFLSPTGDHYRTRLTHVIEVSQIARTISKALRLNDDLTEAIALGHDLGHTPFGHAGEHALNQIHGSGFRHWEHSLRVVDVLANNRKGLNLTWEVRDGIVHHSKGKSSPLIGSNKEAPATLEGKIVRISDIVAYANHDLEDALRAKLILKKDVPVECIEILGNTHSRRINTMVSDIITQTRELGKNQVAMSKRVMTATSRLRDFLFECVYENPVITKETDKAVKLIHDLYEYFIEHPDALIEMSGRKQLQDDIHQEACDFIAGMSDRYALNLFQRVFVPQPWEELGMAGMDF